MIHPAVAFAFCDAQYSTLSETRQLMDKGFALKARITTDPHTKVILKGEAPWRQEATYAPEPHKHDAFDGHPSHMPAASAPTRGSTRPRLPLDYRQVDQPTAMIEDHPMDQGSSSVSPPPTNRQVTPPYSGRNGDKGKRSAPYQGDRRLPPKNFARSEQYPPPRTYDTHIPTTRGDTFVFRDSQTTTVQKRGEDSTQLCASCTSSSTRINSGAGRCTSVQRRRNHAVKAN